MKQLKFDHELAQQIKKGTKNSTFRVLDDKDIKLGDSIEVIDKVDQEKPESWLITGKAVVNQVTEKRIKDIKESDWEGHENYIDGHNFLDTFKRYYGNAISEETPVKIIHFNFQPYTTPKSFNEVSPRLRINAEGTTVDLYADGGSRGNPGPSAGGFVILDAEGGILDKSNKYIGITTNNQAEYHALKGGLEACLALGYLDVNVYMDSLLVVNQMKGIFKVKNKDLWPIHQAIKDMVPQFKSISFTHVPRELNKLADAQVNEALDAISGTTGLQ